jgi:predicted transposase/invertase (TIGR01784 family)
MNAKDLQTYKKFKDQITLSESVYETAYYEGEFKGMEKGIEQGIEKGREEGIEQGIEKGIEKGIEQEKLKWILNVFKEGLSIESIARIARIPENEVHDILERHDLI